MNLLKSFFNSHSRWAEILRYASGCGCGIILKIVISAALTYVGISFFWGYLICHLVVLIESFCFHYLITFRRRFESWKKLLEDIAKYTSMVFGIKLLDFLLVVVAAGYLKNYLLSKQAPEYAVVICNSAVIAIISIFIFVLRYFLYRVIFRKLDYQYYTGAVRSAQIVHAQDREIAENAASGGAVTALLADMLESGRINGAVVSRMDWSGKTVPAAHGFIARSREELIAAQGSIYFDFPLLSGELMRQIRQFDGQLAVVALPCQVTALRKICARDPEIAARVKVIIGLFCGHATRRDLLPAVLNKANININDVKAYRFRRGAWRGYSQTFLRNGQVITRPTAFYNLYQNLFVCCAERCLHCTDHFAEEADISCGDIWMLKYKHANAKPSMTAVRTLVGEEVMNQACASGAVTVELVDQEKLFKANSRSAIFHKAAAARKKAFARYNIAIRVPEQVPKARWNEVLAARIIARIYCSRPDKILRKSRRLLKVYLYIFKALTSF